MEISINAGTSLWEDRWRLFWSNLLNLALAVSTAIAIFDPSKTVSFRLGPAALAAALAAWHWWWCPKHPEWDEQLGPMAAYYAGVLVLGGLLMARAEAYGLLAFVLLMQPFVVFPGRWPVAGVTAGAFATMLANGGLSGEGDASTVGWLLVNVAVASTIGLFIRHISAQSEQRREMLTELAQAHAELAASTAANADLQAQLLGQAREAGVREERQRLAGEIHDTLAQGLTGIITQLEAAQLALPSGQRHVAEAARLARESLAEARRSVHALRPARLEAAQLPDAIGGVAAAWSASYGVPIQVSTTGTPQPMHPEVEVTLLRAAQEGLANIAKHAGANRAGLTLSYMDDAVTLDVRDDGAGFDPATLPDSAVDAFGLATMRERLARLGGSLAIESAPGNGTALSASVPSLPLDASR